MPIYVSIYNALDQDDELDDFLENLLIIRNRLWQLVLCDERKI